MDISSPHTFHIPVMGLAYTIDTPVKVARYGINSVISIIEDNLIELMRRHYYRQLNRPYKPITPKDDDYRARRITDYLNLVNTIVKEQVEKLKVSAFEAGSEITKYFEMLPDSNMLRKVYERMKISDNVYEKGELQKYLRNQVRPGRIDVNIMTKVDKVNYDRGKIREDSSDAVAALRGYGLSDLAHSAIIFSAGLNPRLFNYLEKLEAFNPLGYGHFNKEVIVKVSDYRSALIQGKYLAKKGIWVSEFRIESGLNCGGHAFATDGTLLGPILQEFKSKREELVRDLFSLYQPAATAKGLKTFSEPHPVRITVQGGIGTFEEAGFLSSEYGVDGTGWGTPFLLCPEATTVDADTFALLKSAQEKDIVLSKSSPLGVRFNYLRGTTAEKERELRIQKGKPGSPCTEKFLVSDTEFTKEPICTASYSYQSKKIEQLKGLNLPEEEYTRRYNDITSKECLCIGLSNSAILHYDLPPIKKLTAVTICPGPNIAYFDSEVTLKEIADHIYGRSSILHRAERPHMFIKELMLNFSYLSEQCCALQSKADKAAKEMVVFGNNLLAGISYYRNMARNIVGKNTSLFLTQLASVEADIKNLLNSNFQPALITT